MPRLDSSAIRRVTYNPKSQKMNVQFVGKGKQYTYVGVPEDVYDDFVNSSSAGKFFNDNIKDDYIAVPSEFVGSVRFDSPDDEDFYEERNMSGKELNERFGFGKKETKTDAELVDIFKKQKAYTEFLRRQEALNRIKERGRIPNDPDIIDPTFRKTVPQSFSRITGEDMSVSKDVLREFQAREGGAGVGGAFSLRPGTSVGAGRVPVTDKNKNIKMGLEYLYKNLGGVAGVMGKPPQTPGGGGGSGGGFFRKIKQTYHALKAGAILSVLGIAVCAALALNPRFRELTKMEQDDFCHKVSQYILYILAVFVAGGLSIVAIRNIVPRIKRALSNKEAIKNIIAALEVDDEETARTILHDAIEDQGIRLTSVKRALGSYDYQRLMDDSL